MTKRHGSNPQKSATGESRFQEGFRYRGFCPMSLLLRWELLQPGELSPDALHRVLAEQRAYSEPRWGDRGLRPNNGRTRRFGWAPVLPPLRVDSGPSGLM